MERRKQSLDSASTSSDSSLTTKIRKCFKRFWSTPERDNKFEHRIVRVHSTQPRVAVPNRRMGSGPMEHEYNTNNTYRGKVYIFNHLKFKKVPNREGSLKDVENLQKSLPKLGFRPEDIKCFQDLKVCEVEEKLDEISKEDHTKNDMLAIFILTHGERDGKIYAHDRDYSVQEVWEHFTADRCETLKGKPKIFFIIACRGSNMDDGAVISVTRKLSVTEIDAVRCRASVSYKIPIWADFLTVYSTIEGYYSYRNIAEGTWYIQAFCQELNNFSEPYMHFIDFLTKVNRSVAVAYSTVFDNPIMNNKKQCPFITSSLTKVINLKIPSNQTKSHGETQQKVRPKSLNSLSKLP